MPVQYDGASTLTQNPIKPGKSFVYEFDVHEGGSLCPPCGSCRKTFTTGVMETDEEIPKGALFEEIFRRFGGLERYEKAPKMMM